jgi:hypothetical protein
VDGWHFNDCEFEGTAQNIRNTYGRVLNELESTDGRAAMTDAPEHFGTLLHAVQDFYSHSNWVELHEQAGECGVAGDPLRELVDDRYEDWIDMAPWRDRGGFMFVEGEPPAGAEVKWYPESKQAMVKIGREAVRAVVTGKVYYLYGFNFLPICNHCPAGLQALHWDWVDPGRNDDGKNRLHKDSAPYRGHFKAVDLAKRQTIHEWCRLVAMVHRRRGAAGVRALFDKWVERTGDGQATAREACLAERGFPVSPASFP